MKSEDYQPKVLSAEETDAAIEDHYASLAEEASEEEELVTRLEELKAAIAVETSTHSLLRMSRELSKVAAALLNTSTMYVE